MRSKLLVFAFFSFTSIHILANEEELLLSPDYDQISFTFEPYTLSSIKIEKLENILSWIYEKWCDFRADQFEHNSSNKHAKWLNNATAIILDHYIEHKKIDITKEDDLWLQNDRCQKQIFNIINELTFKQDYKTANKNNDLKIALLKILLKQYHDFFQNPAHDMLGVLEKNIKLSLFLSSQLLSILKDLKDA